MKKFFKFYLFFILVYFLQGIKALPSQALYYLMREDWGLTVQKIAYIGAISTIAWVIKPVYGLISDLLPIRRKRTKYYLLFNYFAMVVLGVWIYFCGLNLNTLIATNILFGLFLASSDVFCDSVMCQKEKEFNMQGKIQSVQWFAIGVAGLITSLGGAYIAKYYNYRIAYILFTVFPAIMFVYLLKTYKEKDSTKKSVEVLRNIKKAIKNKQLWVALVFLFCFYLSPSFGVPLMVKMREVLHIDKMFIGLLGTVGTIFGLIGYALYFFKVHKFALKPMLYLMVMVSAITTLFYLYIPNQWVLLGYNIVFGTIGAIIHLIILSYCAKITPEGAEGFTFAGIMSILNGGAMGSSALGGFLYPKVGYNNLVIISAVMTALCLIFIPRLKIGLKNEN